MDPLLAEGFPSPISPLTYSTINDKYDANKAGKRISLAFEKHIHRAESDHDSHELYVIHANVIRYFVARAL